jgi:purine-nucleoside phosphorylase
MLAAIKRSADYVGRFLSRRPEFAIILGTGLGNFADEVKINAEIPTKNIPGFPVSGVEGHQGALLLADINGLLVLIMQGRVHYYEGYSMEQVVFPVRVCYFLGVHTLILTNAAGGINPEFSVGDLMIINDHINMMPNPLIGSHIPEFGPRFPDMSQAYDKQLIEEAKKIAKNENIKVFEGCYVGVTGPTYETPAEYRFYHKIGGDAIGMSTVPEVIAANQMGMRCFAMSVITDMGTGEQVQYLTHEMVQEAANKAEPKMAKIVLGLLKRI